MSKLKIYHPNAKGTGSGLSLELYPAHDEVRGFVVATLTPQKTAGEYADGMCILPTFDHDAEISVKFDITELAQLLEVLRGYKEKVNDGNGFFHRTRTANIIATFEHRLEPLPSYFLHFTRKEADGEPRRIGITITMPEAIALNEAISQSLVYVAFGVPSVK